MSHLTGSALCPIMAGFRQISGNAQRAEQGAGPSPFQRGALGRLKRHPALRRDLP